MLRLAPTLVGDYRGAAAIDPGTPFTPASRGWITRERSAPGHIGWPEFATAEKGEHLFNEFASDVVAFLERVVRWDGKSWNG
ncbi:MAG: creatininase family protein, partial [Opitutaceae bacterium]